MNLPPAPPPTSPEGHPYQKQKLNKDQPERKTAGSDGTAASTTIEATKEQKDQINFGLFAPTRILKFLLSELKSKLNGLLPTEGKILRFFLLKQVV